MDLWNHLFAGGPTHQSLGKNFVYFSYLNILCYLF
jgi:hypothetical protein